MEFHETGFNASSNIIRNEEWLVGALRKHHLRVGYGEPLRYALYQTVLLRNCQHSLLLVTVLTTVAVYNRWYVLVTVTLCKFELQSVQLGTLRMITSYLKWHSDLC
jgi:hypothetical protein